VTAAQAAQATDRRDRSEISQVANGTQMRTYRLALAATGEYTAFYGGTVAGALAGMVTTMNRVNSIYERDLAVHMNLVANDNLLIYTDAATDPYTNRDGVAMLSQNQTNLTNIIGTGNYDIGHVFSTGGGGVAYLGVVCASTLKARGVTGLSAPVGDAFDVDYVAHEMGHQFGGNHTFNGSTSNCGGGNRNAGTAYEPGSGSTIMGYAGICGAEDLQPHSDDYFHAGNQAEMITFLTSGGGSTCGVVTSTGNTVPTASAGPDFTIPANTPFSLTAFSIDGYPNNPTLTYAWEEFDLGAASPPNTDDGSRPIFRSFPPASSPTRTFPRLSSLVSNTLPLGESLPTTNRAMTFRVTVRDNAAGGGATNSDDMVLSVTTAAGPFVVTAPNTAVTWPRGTSQAVTWNVANTSAAPVSTASVKITLSTDGGLTYPTVLAASTPNNGSATITVPNVVTTMARVRVEAIGNVFFDISNVNFTIAGSFAAGSASIVSESAVNGWLDPGEVVTMSLCLTNTAGSPSGSLTGGLAATGGVLSPSGAQSYGVLSPGATTCRNHTFSVNVICGGTLTATLQVQESGGGTSNLQYILPVGNPVTIFSQNFDAVSAPALPAGWSTSTLTGTANAWITVNGTGDASPNSVVAYDLGSISDSVLVTPTIAVPAGGGQLTFRHRYITDGDYDGGVLEISISGGGFQDIIAAGGSFGSGPYSGALNGAESNPLGVRSAWVGDSSGFITTSVNLPATAAGHNIVLRWRFGSGATVVGSGWFVDTVAIASTSCVAQGTVIATPTSLKFGASKNGAAGALTALTPAQSVVVAFVGGGSGWTATSNQSWLQLTSASGSGAGTLTATVANPGNIIGGSTSLSATITVTALASTNSPLTIPVTLAVDQTGSSTQPAFGQVDTPLQSATGIVGAIGVTGWAVDDVGLQHVKIYRNCLAFEQAYNCKVFLGNNLVYIGDAAFVPGARPDVEANFPTYPAANAAGWGYLLLTNMLPDVTSNLGYGGNGTITLYVLATDWEGHETLLGRSQVDHTPTDITLANAGIAKPFGALDTPSQGGTVSGTFPNFGWVLTPDLNTIADGTDILMPTNGSTITLYIDGVAKGTVTYNQCRGSVGNPVPPGLYCNDDVANIFGNLTPQVTFTTRTSNPTKFRNLDAGRSAIGSYDVNTSTMTNGVHSIAWGVSDSAGRGEGIGSRNFFVLNASGGATLLGEELTGLNAVAGTSPDAVRAEMLAAVESRGDISALPAVLSGMSVRGRTGFAPRSLFGDIAADADGVRRIQMPDMGRIELHLGGFTSAGYLVAGQSLRDLPVGSHLDATTGTFTWVPVPGHMGTYHLVFIVDGAQLRVDVTVRPGGSR
jgi:hypothetical protein